jgi:hypothetical protein
MTVSDIIQDALTDLGVLAAGEVVSAVDQETCFRAFKNMITSLPGFGLGGALYSVLVSTSPHAAKVNEQITYTGVGSLTVTFPSVLPTDEPIINGSRIAINSGPQAGVYVYISANASWLAVNDITEATDNPLGIDCNQSLTDMLAYRVARRFGRPITQEISMAADKGERTIAARFAPDMTAELDPALWSYWSDVAVNLS